jgi:Tol biopolymer transport system component
VVTFAPGSSYVIRYAPVTVSQNGVLAYATGGTPLSNQIVWLDRLGKQVRPVSAFGSVFAPSISPDEDKIAFTRNAADGTNDVFLRDLARATDRRFTTDASQNFDPVWSPNADRVAFRSNRRGSPGDLYQKAVTGSDEDELLLSTPNAKVVNQWSRDGRIVYTEIDPKTKEDLWILLADRRRVKFLQTEFKEFQGQISPDGHWMAYTLDDTRQRDVYVRPFPPYEGIWKISTAGGEQPRWRGDSRELFFVGADGKLTAVAVKGSVGAKPSFEIGAPEPLFDAHIVATITDAHQYDVTADGKRFLVRTTNVGVSAPVTVVVNWSAVLRK